MTIRRSAHALQSIVLFSFLQVFIAPEMTVIVYVHQKNDKREKATQKPTKKPKKTSKPTNKPNSTKRKTTKPTKKPNSATRKTLPPCQVRGTNYHRCDPNKMKSRDHATCRQIDNELCAQQKRKMNRRDASYCECIGLKPSSAEENVLVDVIGQLRGFISI